MKHIKSVLAATAIAMILPVVATAQENIKVGTFVPEQSTGVAGVIKPWMEAVATEAGDAVSLQGFWGGTLGKSPYKQFEMVQNGVADVSWVLPGYTSGQFPEMNIFELPFLFNSSHEASIVGWKLHEQNLFTGMDGVHLIGFFATEPNALFMKTEIDSLEDLDGMKIRSVGPIHANWLESFGAAAQTLSSAEYNEALNRGTIDGVIQGWTGMRSFKSFPLVNQAYRVPAGTIPFLLLMNEGKWSSLSPEVQDVIMKHGGMAMAKAGATAYATVSDTIIDSVRAEGALKMSAPSNTQNTDYADRAIEIHRWWIKRTPNGQAVYDEAIRILNELREQG